MSENTGKVAVALLAVVAGLQVWTLNRQAALEQRLQNVTAMQNQLDMNTRDRLEGLYQRLHEMTEADRWMVVQHQSLEPLGSCETAQARVEWELRQWASGTESRLLYRTGPDENWQEATVEERGGQNYAASFTLPAQPLLEVGVDVSYAQPRGSTSKVEEAFAREKSKFDRDYEYQIVAEGPDFSRSSGAKRIPVHGEFVVPAKISVDVERDGRYKVRLFSETTGRKACASLESAELRAYAGERLAHSTTLAEQNQHERSAEWTSEESLTRLELILRHGGGEEVIPVTLSSH